MTPHRVSCPESTVRHFRRIYRGMTTPRLPAALRFCRDFVAAHVPGMDSYQLVTVFCLCLSTAARALGVDGSRPHGAHAYPCHPKADYCPVWCRRSAAVALAAFLHGVREQETLADATFYAYVAFSIWSSSGATANAQGGRWVYLAWQVVKTAVKLWVAFRA